MNSITFEKLLDEWTRTVGPQIASVTRPVAFALMTGALYVKVSTPQWGGELAALEPELLAALPATIDSVPLKKIVWQRETAPAVKAGRRVGWPTRGGAA